MKTVSSCFALLLALQHFLKQHDRNDEDQQQDDRHRRGDRPVTVVEEFVPKRLADHQGLRTTQQVGNDEFTNGGNENEKTAGDNARAGPAAP